MPATQTEAIYRRYAITEEKMLSEAAGKLVQNRRVLYGREEGTERNPNNANAFRHGLAAVQSRRANGALTVEE